ncbi:hypothetical protein Zmor_019999 [Zophobas morio]|uniref:Uncharacterized protein n=1 Tax=Zophobas morio TaxID=2755281 RepID=A0AA38I656_9CUCU|nr:hypothetical protein Zmor_019999 [Zophobas morio]
MGQLTSSLHLLVLLKHQEYFILCMPLLDGSMSQLWFLSADGRITNNAGKGWTLDIHNEVFVPGGLLKIQPEKEVQSQYFFIEEKI